MNWDKLRVFHTVAQANSFTEAGQMLNLSQSAVSRQISALEESLKVTLFHRHARGLLLTEQGELLQSATNDIATKLKLMEGKLSDTRHIAEGPLVVTVSDFVGTTWLATRLGGFHAEFPEIQLTVLFDERVFNIGMREADAAIRLHKPKPKDVISKKLSTINFHICASKSYLSKYGTPKNVDDLKKHCLIAFPPGAYAPVDEPAWLLDIAKTSEDKNNNLLLMNSMYAINKAVQADVGIAVLPDYLIHAHDHLEVVLPNVERPSVDMYFVYAEERQNSKRIKAFMDFLLKTVDETAF